MSAAPPPPLTDPALCSVLLVRLRVGLGDLLCSMPAVRVVRRTRPDVHIAMATWSEMEPVLSRGGDIELVPFPGYPGIPERRPRPEEWPTFVATCRERGFDLAVQMYGNRPAANDVTRAVGARQLGGFAPTRWTPDCHGWWLPYPHRVHEVWRHLRLVELLGATVSPDDAALYWPETAQDRAEWALVAATHRLRPGEYAVVHPGATSASRRWPPHRYAAVADVLASRGLVVVVTGVAGEEGLLTQMRQHARCDLVDLVGRTTLGAFAALVRRAALVVGNDTGTAHLAVAVGTPTVTVFLSGDPVRWAYRQSNHGLVRVGVSCSPCPHLVCPIDFPCAELLSTAAVVSEVEARLQRPWPGR